MKRSKYTDEQILAIVKEGEAGRKVADLCRAHGITEQTYYRWTKGNCYSDRGDVASTKPPSGEVGHKSGTVSPDRGPRLPRLKVSL